MKYRKVVAQAITYFEAVFHLSIDVLPNLTGFLH